MAKIACLQAALASSRAIAREFHDSVSQALYSITLGADAVRMLLDQDPDRTVESLDYILSGTSGIENRAGRSWPGCEHVPNTG